MKAIILAGGQGTRLRPVIGDEMPKCLAPVMGRPMIEMVIRQMKKHGITDITLALGYKAEKFKEPYGHMKMVVEKKPLGTGGAIRNCLMDDEPTLVVNGDTLALIDYKKMLEYHKDHGLSLTIAMTYEGRSAGNYILTRDIFDGTPGPYLSMEHDVIPRTPFSTYYVPWYSDFGTPETYAQTPKEWV